MYLYFHSVFRKETGNSVTVAVLGEENQSTGDSVWEGDLLFTAYIFVQFGGEMPYLL